MSTLEKLREAGLESQLNSAVDSYATDQLTEEKRTELLSLIDTAGLKVPLVLKHIGNLQREKVLKPGLFGEVTKLQDELNGAASAEDQDSEDSVLSEKQEARVRERMKKEEERLRDRMRKRLADRERKIRERMVVGAEKRAARAGLKVQESKELQDARSELASIREQKKELRDREKGAREKIRSLRPRRTIKKKKDATGENASQSQEASE